MASGGWGEGACLTEQVCPGDASVVLDADAHPDVRPPRQIRIEGEQSLGTLREYLEAAPVRLPHDLEHLMHELVRDVLMREIAHGVDEDRARLAPGHPCLSSEHGRQVNMFTISIL